MVLKETDQIIPRKETIFKPGDDWGKKENENNGSYMDKKTDQTGKGWYSPILEGSTQILKQEAMIKIGTVKRILEEKKNIIESYDDNWDDESAKKIPPNTIKSLDNIINHLYEKILHHSPSLIFQLPEPYLLPNADGSIDIVWRNEIIYFILNISEKKGFAIAGKSNFSDFSLSTNKNPTNMIRDYFSLVFSEKYA